MKYELQGGTLPVVICHLEGGETMVTERGSMAWMSPNMRMETSTNGGLGKAFGRMFSGLLCGVCHRQAPKQIACIRIQSILGANLRHTKRQLYAGCTQFVFAFYGMA